MVGTLLPTGKNTGLAMPVVPEDITHGLSQHDDSRFPLCSPCWFIQEFFLLCFLSCEMATCCATIRKYWGNAGHLNVCLLINLCSLNYLLF